MNEKSWLGCEGATLEDLNGLSAVTGNVLPTSYLSFLGNSNGGEGPLRDDPYWMVLDPATDVAAAVATSTFSKSFPGLLVIGGNGAGEGIAFDFRADHDGRIVFFDMTNSDLMESIRPLAGSFSALLDLIGEPDI